MDVFLAGIIQGSIVEAAIHPQDWREPIRQAIRRHFLDANVYCHYTQHPNSISYDLDQIRETMEEGNRRAAQCDVLVAYVPSASMGTAVEMYLASKGGAVVLTISPLAANWVVRLYSDCIFGDVDEFEEFLASSQLEHLLAAKQSNRGRRGRSKTSEK